MSYYGLSFRSHGGGDVGGSEGADGGGADGGGADAQPVVGQLFIPLSPLEKKARTHALLCSIGFLILLPLGVLLARYARTFTKRWFWGHAVMQLVIAGPVIFTGWAMGHNLANVLELQSLRDRHQLIGIALLALYATQLLLGTIIHFFKMPPRLFHGHRPPQNYLHVVLGLAILALAAYQVHYGLYFEWLYTGGLHQVVESAKHAWLALVIVRKFPAIPNSTPPEADINDTNSVTGLLGALFPRHGTFAATVLA
ncbi:hypothetical protein B0H12DRAFT_1197190 [Mycena haematopus]|nr:hypothetical protein B0H12DRAFT_1197190 [Mycena haematopus]